jgi:hypothetical protein
MKLPLKRGNALSKKPMISIWALFPLLCMLIMSIVFPRHDMLYPTLDMNIKGGIYILDFLRKVIDVKRRAEVVDSAA